MTKEGILLRAIYEDSYKYLKNIEEDGVVYCKNKKDAKVFDTTKELLNTMKSNFAKFKKTNDNEDISNYCIDFTSKKYNEKYTKELHTNEDLYYDFDALLTIYDDLSITTYDVVSKYDIYKNGVISEEEYKDEIIKRMGKLGLCKPIINLFKEEEKVYMVRENGGFYDLDKTTEKILNYLSYNEKDFHPYLVLKNGNMYSILYVSPYKDEWELYEHPQKVDEEFGQGFVLDAICGYEEYLTSSCYDKGSIVIKNNIAGSVTRIA